MPVIYLRVPRASTALPVSHQASPQLLTAQDLEAISPCPSDAGAWPVPSSLPYLIMGPLEPGLPMAQPSLSLAPSL